MSRFFHERWLIGVLLIVLSGCGLRYHSATEQRGVPMVVNSRYALLYQGNEIIGKLPVGTQVTVLEQGDVWSKVELYVEPYDLRVQGSLHTEELAPLPKKAEVHLEPSEEPPVSAGLSFRREDLWQSYLVGRGINAIVHTPDAIWIGTDEGLYRFAGGNPQAQQVFDSTDGLADDAVLAIAPDGDALWLGTFVGLSYFKNGDFVNYGTKDGLLKGAVMAIDVTPGAVWLGLSSGIAKFDKKTRKFQNWPRGGGWSPEAGSGSAPGSSKNAIYADSLQVQGDSVWHAAFNLTRTAMDGKIVKTYGCGDGLIHSRVVDFILDGQQVWCVTIHGLTLLDTTVPKKYERFYTNRNPRENPLVAAVRDGETIWLAYKEGLARFHMSRKKLVTYYAVWDLFDGRYISTLAADAEYLWVGTADGLWRMNKALAEQISDENLVDDFESASRIRHRGWPIRVDDPTQRVVCSIDATGGANGTQHALRIDYTAPDYKEHSLGYVGVDLSTLDFTDADGISFYVRGEPAVRLSADVSEDRESWSVGSWNVPNVWMQVKVPFEQFRVHAQGSGNRILELYAIRRLSFHISRDENLGNRPKPGHPGRVWIDEIRFYKDEPSTLVAAPVRR